jgi:hypothetical protein
LDDLPAEPVAGIDPAMIESVVRDRDVAVDDLVAALEETAATVDAEWAADVAAAEPIEHDGRRVFAIAMSAWGEDGDLGTLGLDADVREAARQAHNEAGKALDEAAGGELARRLRAYDALVLG